MGNQNNFKNKNQERKLYIDLLTNNKIVQPEEFCGNKIETTRFTV